jgi:hypothetical protein
MPYVKSWGSSVPPAHEYPLGHATQVSLAPISAYDPDGHVSATTCDHNIANKKQKVPSERFA